MGTKRKVKTKRGKQKPAATLRISTRARSKQKLVEADAQPYQPSHINKAFVCPDLDQFQELINVPDVPNSPDPIWNLPSTTPLCVAVTLPEEHHTINLPTETTPSPTFSSPASPQNLSTASTHLNPEDMANEAIDLMNRLLTRLAAKPSTEIQPAIFTGADNDNILEWLENFQRIANHNSWNDAKQLSVIPVYLQKSALTFYRSLPDATKQT